MKNQAWLLENIRMELTMEDPGLVGCRRRGKWSRGVSEYPWRWMRGNAILQSVASRRYVQTPVGLVEFYITNGALLVFRGGKWALDWVEDLYDLWSLAVDRHDLSRTILVVHEYHGELDIKEIEVPEAMCPKARVKKMLAEYTADPPGRIPKSGQRALRVCPHCPHKQRCDALDILHGDQNDWSPLYPTP